MRVKTTPKSKAGPLSQTRSLARTRALRTAVVEPPEPSAAAQATVDTGGTPTLGHGGQAGFVDRLVALRMGTPLGPVHAASVNSVESSAPVASAHNLAEESKTWDATQTAALIRSGEVSAVEVVQAAITRAKATDAELHAIVHELYAQGLAAATSERRGCFAGVPTFIKDMEDLAGAPTGLGSAAIKPGPAQETAASVAQFLSSGTITIGKSSTAEFGLNATTEPVFGKPTCNPHHLGHSVGGSSGGAAALVAAGVVPIAHGGDGGGSIRIPAAFCGLVGLKASRGRLVPMATSKRMPVKLATYGVLTRSVRDTAAFFAEVDHPIQGLAPIGKVEGPGNTKRRIGVFIDPPNGSPVDPEVRAACLAVAKTLEGQGHQVDFVPAPYDQQLVDDFLLHWGLLAFGVEQIVKRQPGGDVERLEPWTRNLAQQAKKNWWRIPTAIWRLRRYQAKYEETFRRCDVLLSPTTAAPAPKLGYLSADQPYEQQVERLLTLLPYTPVQNTSGGPAISVPVAKNKDGLPIGVQLASPMGEERRLLELAFALEHQG
jgi:amidase